MAGRRWDFLSRLSVDGDDALAPVTEEFGQRQHAHLLTVTPLLAVTNAAFAWLAAYLVMQPGAPDFAWVWAGLMTLACAGLLLAGLVTGRLDPDAVDARRVNLSAALAAALLGLFWGMGGAVAVGYATEMAAVVSAFLLYLLVGLVAMTLISQPVVGRIFALLAIVPVAVLLLMKVGAASILAALVGIIVLGLIQYGGGLAYRQLVDQALACAEAERIETNLTDALEGISDAFALFDADGEVLVRNRRHRELFRGRSGLIPQIHRPNEVFKTGGGRWLQANSRRTLGQLLVTTYADISALKQREQELDEALKSAADADQDRSMFFALISHELRTPLNSIIGFTEIVEGKLLKAPVDAKTVDQIRHVKSAARHLLSIVNNTLDLSKIEARSYDLHRTRFSVIQPMREAVILLEDAARRRNITIDEIIDDDVPSLYADEMAVKQMLINLLSNAVKFSRENGEISMHASRRGSEVHIAVRDHGVGIAPDQLKKVFAPYGQAGRAAGRSHGTGLGIPLVVKLIELHGGRFDIESEAGRGTIATVIFNPASIADDRGQRASGDGAKQAKGA